MCLTFMPSLTRFSFTNHVIYCLKLSTLCSFLNCYQKQACPRMALVYWNSQPRKPIGIKCFLETRNKTTVRIERCSLVHPIAEFLSDSNHHWTSPKTQHLFSPRYTECHFFTRSIRSVPIDIPYLSVFN